MLYSYGLGGLVEKDRMKGQQDTFDDPEGLITSFQGSCNYFWYLWKCGKSDLKIVNLKDFEVNEHIEKFWTYQGVPSVPICAVSDIHAERILAVSSITPDTMIMHFYQNYKEKTPENHFPFASQNLVRVESSHKGWSELLLEKVPSMFQITCMEVS